MNILKPTSHIKKQDEKGQALVIGAGILFCLAIALLFYLSVQRAYNLANFLDETAELAAQSAAEPIADDIVNGRVRVDSAKATDKANATVLFSADSIKGEINPTTISTTVRTLNPSEAVTVEDDVCEEFNITPGNRECLFPIVVVDLELPHTLFGISFTIRSRGVATLGSNSRQPDAVGVNLPTPTPLPTSAPIIITIPTSTP